MTIDDLFYMLYPHMTEMPTLKFYVILLLFAAVPSLVVLCMLHLKYNSVVLPNEIPYSVFPRQEWSVYIQLEHLPNDFGKILIRKMAYDSNASPEELEYVAYSLPDKFRSDRQVCEAEQTAQNRLRTIQKIKK